MLLRQSSSVVGLGFVLLVVATYFWLRRTGVSLDYSQASFEARLRAAVAALPANSSPDTARLSEELEAELEGQLYRYIYSIVDYKCQSPVHVGGVGPYAGGYDICTDGDLQLTRPCLVYSFGIGNIWTFDDDITKNFGCRLLAYDPTMGVSDHNRSQLISFFNTGIGAVDGLNEHKWKVQTYTGLLRENGHEQSVVDILKIDVEHAEWDSLAHVLSTSSGLTALSHVKQLLIEFHVRDAWLADHGWTASTGDLVIYWRILLQLRGVGFRAWKIHEAPWPSSHYWSQRRKLDKKLISCWEILFINTNFHAP